MKVLIVEDDQNELRSLVLAVKSLGFQVLGISRAQEAIDHLDKGEAIGLVITDYLMPEMDGISLLREIRRKRPSLPVIMITGYADKDLAIRALHSKCDGFLEKPFALDALRKEIERVTINAIESRNSGWVVSPISKIVHQINNPLTAITGACELGMLDLNDPVISKRCFKRILEAVTKIKEVNRSLLSHGKAAFSIPQDGTDLHYVLNKSIDSFFGLIVLKKIEMVTEFADQGVRVQASEFALDQVFKNLIMNSIESLEQRNKRRITLKTELHERGHVTIWIHDTGSGIPKDIISMIFHPFITNKASGNGLGLAVVKEIVDGIGGKIEVKSREGKGTKFRIDIPVKLVATKKEI